MWGHRSKDPTLAQLQAKVEDLDGRMETMSRCLNVLQREVTSFSYWILMPDGKGQAKIVYWRSRYELTARGMDDRTINELLGPEPKA